MSKMMDVEGERNALTLAECVDILEQEEAVRKKPATRGDGSSVLVILKERACDEGLTEEQISRLVHVGTSKKYSDALVNQIIKCLIPRDGVPSGCIVDLISKMCAVAISVNIQISFLKWLILVYEWISDKETVHCLYGMLFLFLDNDGLCPYICNLLYCMTRKDDVKPFRIRKLLDLLAKVGQQPHLLGLLSLYKVHAPHVVSVNIPRIRKAFFKRKDTKWLDIVWRLKSTRNKNAKESDFALDKDAVTVLPASKRRRKDAIIPSSRAYCLSIDDGMPNMRVTFDQIATFNDLLRNFDKLEFPNQMGCVLESKYLQHLMVCTTDESAVERLNFWLQITLHEELVCAPSGVTSKRVTMFLEALLNFVSFYGKPLSSLELCLGQYLLTWNGVDYQALILLLVSHLQIRQFNTLNRLVLEPLRKLFFCSDVQFKCQVLTCFTEMLLNYATATITSPQESKRSQSTSASPLSAHDIPETDKETTQICVLMKGLVGFVDKISAIALQLESDHVLLQHCILCFFEQVVILHHHYALRFVHIPSPAIVYRFLFASNPMAVSRLCNLAVAYKDAFERLKLAQRSGMAEEVFVGLEGIHQFNDYILDISNTIWRNKAFLARKDGTKSLCYEIPRQITNALDVPHINERFSIVNHVAFVYIAKKFLMQTQAEGMKLNPSLIQGKTRSAYLEYLQRNNLDGVVRFLNTFIRPKTV